MKIFRTLKAQSIETEKGIGLSLAGLVIVAIVPLLLFGSSVGWMIVAQKKAAVAAELASTARALQVAVDRELLSQFTIMETLTPDFSFNAAKLSDLHKRANRAVKTNREWLNVGLIDPRSHQIMIGSPPVPHPLPESLSPRHVDQVVQTRKPLIVGAFASSKITGGPIILLMSPVMNGNEVRYVLGVAMNPKTISDVFVEQKLPPSWTGAVIDTNMMIAGRSRDPERYIGVHATPTLADRISGSESGMFTALNQEGATVQTVFSRSPATGWSVVIGVPAAEVEGPIRRILFQLAATGGLLIILSLFLTGIVGRVIVRRRNAYEHELQNSQLRLKDSLQEFSDLVARVPLGVYKFRMLKEGGHRFDFVSARWCEILGLTEEEVYRDASVAFHRIHPDDLPEFVRLNEVARNASQPFEWEGRCIGLLDEIWLHIESSANLLPSGDIIWNGIVYDITERRRSEELLRLTRFSIEHFSDGIFWMTREGRIVDVNEAACLSLGYSRDELLQLTIPDIDPNVGEEVWSQHFEQIRQHNTLKSETIHRSKSGKQFPVEIVANYIKYGSKEHICTTVRDITERKQLEAEKLEMERHFQQTQRLESLGVLAGGIAHDFNNILMIIMGNCSLAKMDPKNITKNLDDIEKASERAAALCRQMLEYAGHTQTSKSKVDMASLLIDMVEMLSSTGHSNVTIKPVVTPNIPCVYGDISQIRQIAINLIVNATEAIGDTLGEIDVMLTKTTISGEQTEKDHLGRVIPAGKYVCLEVTDNGCGMNAETQGKIFEPFFTTKFTGRGLGLSATLGIISGHDGALQLLSQPGKGSTFKVYLPAHTSDSSGDDKQQQVTSVPWHGSGTILLVEDEDQVRILAKTILKKFGFTVIESANGKEALELFQQNTDKIRLVITDVGMPVMDGYELLNELKKLDPELPIIVSSGYGDAEVRSRIGSDNIAGLISKPYNPDQLREVLQGIVVSCR